MKKKFTRLLGVGLTIALLTSLLTVAVPASALTQPAVSVGNPTISATTTYTVIFTLAKDVSDNGSFIVIDFPTGTDLTSVAATDVTISATAGIGSGAFSGVVPAHIDKSPSTTTGPTIAITVPDITGETKIGIGALVAVAVADVKNPGTAGSYTLAVSTLYSSGSTNEAAVTSASYTLITPTLIPLPGIVERYNSAGVLMQQTSSISMAISAAAAGDTIKVGPGTYDEDITVDKSLTIQGSAAGTTVIKDVSDGAGGAPDKIGGTVTISFVKTATAAGVVFDGFTVYGDTGGASPMTITGDGATVKNCVFTKPGLETTAVTQTMAVVNPAATPTYGNTITTCSFTTTLGSAYDIGVDIQSANGIGTTVSDCTFLVDATTTGTSDVAIQVAAGTSLLPATLSGNTITGSSGIGIKTTGGTTKVSKNTLKTLTNALNVTGGNVTVSDSSIEGCGSSIAGLGDAIEIGTSAGTVRFYNNTIKDSSAVNNAFDIAGGTVNIYFNSITGNTKNIATAVAIDARHNWWGASSGPASGSVTGVGVATSKISPYLGVSPSSASAAFGLSSISTQTTIGVDVSCVDSSGSAKTVSTIAVGKYSANPQTVAPTIVGTGSVLGYYDVFVPDTTGVTTIQIKLYGAITGYTKVYYGGSIAGTWIAPSSSGVNVAGGYAYVTITSGSSPSLVDLNGTPFALVDDKTVSAPTIKGPEVGSYNVSVMPMFVWDAVPGAIRYEIALAEDQTFAILEWSYNVSNPFYKAEEELKYSTTYYWRVRGILAEPYMVGPTWVTPSSKWATGIFTTEAEPVEAAPIIVEPATPPDIKVDVSPPVVTVEAPTAQAIPTYILWIIVGVGAVLIIALIVLIVRTRRVT